MAIPFVSNQTPALNNVRQNGSGVQLSQLSSAADRIDANRAASLLRSANIPPGAEPTFNSTTVAAQFSVDPNAFDWRVRIDCPAIRKEQILQPLTATNGVVWPYLPSVTISHSANYSQISTTHNNFPFYAYNNSQVDDINITGDFSVQSQDEAKYWLATMHFFRTVTKMYFGQGPNLGNPPPICTLNGYGDFVFKDISVVVKNFTIDMPKDVDYIATDSSRTDRDRQTVGGLTYVPTLSTLTVVVTPVYSREKIKSFNLEEFAKGNLILSGDGRGFI